MQTVSHPPAQKEEPPKREKVLDGEKAHATKDTAAPSKKQDPKKNPTKNGNTKPEKPAGKTTAPSKKATGKARIHP